MIGAQFHSTPFADGFPHDEWSHVGTRAAAGDRIRNVSPGDFGLPEDVPATLHTVRLAGEVYPRTLTDEQAGDISTTDDPGVLTEYGMPCGRGYRVFRYINTTEAPGSVSYLAHWSSIRVICTERIPAAPWRAAPERRPG